MTRMIRVRHGRTGWNRVERFRGQTDIPLNEVGLAQAEATARRIASEWQPVAVYSSPLSRAAKTAEAIAGQLGLRVQIGHGFADINYGQWQGLTPDESRERWPEIVKALYDTPDAARIPEGETLGNLRHCAVRAARRLAADHAANTFVAVSQTIVNRAIVLGALGPPNRAFWHLRQDNGAINVLELEDGEWALVSMNETTHLRSISEPAS